MFGEAVEAERKAVARAHGRDLKVDAVGGDADELGVPVHGHSEMLPQSKAQIIKNDDFAGLRKLFVGVILSRNVIRRSW